MNNRITLRDLQELVKARYKLTYIAKSLGLSVGSVSMYLSGKRNPPPYFVHKISYLMGIKLETVMQAFIHAKNVKNGRA